MSDTNHCVNEKIFIFGSQFGKTAYYNEIVKKMKRKGHVMDERKFPILSRKKITVQWKFVEQYRDIIFKHHRQTLEELERRGGLSPNEIIWAIENLTWSEMTSLSEDECIAKIVQLGAVK